MLPDHCVRSDTSEGIPAVCSQSPPPPSCSGSDPPLFVGCAPPGPLALCPSSSCSEPETPLHRIFGLASPSDGCQNAKSGAVRSGNTALPELPQRLNQPCVPCVAATGKARPGRPPPPPSRAAPDSAAGRRSEARPHRACASVYVGVYEWRFFARRGLHSAVPGVRVKLVGQCSLQIDGSVLACVMVRLL